MINNSVIVIFAYLLISMSATSECLAKELLRVKRATVTRDNDVLVVNTGVMKRSWKWTGRGLITIELRDLRSNNNWAITSKNNSDWSLPEAEGIENHTASWISTTAEKRNDDGFSNDYIEVVSTIRYEQQHLELQHVIWVYPEATGLRTQLRVKALNGFSPAQLITDDTPYKSYDASFLRPGARSECLPLNLSIPNERLYWGYYNDPGNRHDQSQDMLKEQLITGWPIFQREDINWASGVAIKYGTSGVMVVKESPKCVNQKAHNTGAFFLRPSELWVTGWGLEPEEILVDRYRECWANWVILYRDGEDGLQKALKQFDALRYPVFPSRDLLLLSNTWGAANPGGAQFTDEKFLLAEIPAMARLGTDIIQIDDGWQKAGSGAGSKDFLPRYRNGWGDIKHKCDEFGLRLGLWVAIKNAEVDDLKYNLDQLKFITWKADFDKLETRADYENRTYKYRQVMKHAWMKTQFSLCPEYDDPRYGWYFAREYGSIFFQNVQEAIPANLTMVPFQVLRQHWLMAKYFPANKLQVMLQNPKRVGVYSDGKLHSHRYCFAMGIPFVPCLFQSAQKLSTRETEELSSAIKSYKQNREDIFTSTTYPIGEKPDNASWAGFQMISTKRKGGYILLFKELHNKEPEKLIKLKFLAGKTLLIVDVERNSKPKQLVVDQHGNAKFAIQKAADYRLFRYQILH